MNVNEVWELIEPYVVQIIGIVLAVASTIATAKTALGGLMNKWSLRLNVNDIAQSVAEKLSGSTLNLDVSAVTEAKLNVIETQLQNTITAQLQEYRALEEKNAKIISALADLLVNSRDLGATAKERIRAELRELVPKEEAPQEAITVRLNVPTLESQEILSPAVSENKDIALE